MSSLYKLIYIPTGAEVATVRRADTWWDKGWGLMGSRPLPEKVGLWLPGVSAVHTVGVPFPLDLLFLDKDFCTLRLTADVRPGRLLVRAKDAQHTLEFNAGTLAHAGISGVPGERWVLKEIKNKSIGAK